MRFILFALFLYFAAFLSRTEAQAERPSGDLAVGSDGTSLVRGQLYNGASMKTMDVLLRSTAFHFLEGKKGLVQNVMMRLVVDFDNERFLTLYGTEQEKTLSDGEIVKSKRFAGAKLLSEKYTYSSFNGFISSEKRTFEKAADHSTLYDLRLVGVTKFPECGSGSDLMPKLLAISSFPDCLVTKMGAKEIEVRRKMLMKNDGITINTLWSFDPKTLTPNSVLRTNNWVKNGFEESIRDYIETIGWETKEGVFVPKIIDQTSVHFDEREPGDESTMYKYDVEETIEFHWFSVNEPLDISRFENVNLNSFKDCFPLLDPRLSGASSLIE